MGWSFRKSFKIVPGVRLNLSKKGLGASFGMKGLRVGVGSGRKVRLTGGIGPFRYYRTMGGAVPGHHGSEEVSAARGCIARIAQVSAVFMLLLTVVTVVAFHEYAGAEHPHSASRPATDAPAPLVLAASVKPPSTIDNDASPSVANSTASTVLALGSGSSAPRLSFEEQARASQREAMHKYPDLANAGSAFNQMFLREYQRQQMATSKHLLDAGWPLWLADQCAARIKNPKLPPIPLER